MFISVALTLSDIFVSDFEREYEAGASEDRKMTWVATKRRIAG